MRLTLGELAEITGATVMGDADIVVDAFTTDSRTAAPGRCFVALAGARDGHDFVTDAASRGAPAALVARVPEGGLAGTLLLVDDPLEALGQIARTVRARRDVPVVGITGSTGKTATKDLAAAALGAQLRVHASPASFNNESGLPLTVLGAPEGVEVLVAEMGARHAGDLAHLCTIARPSVGVVTNIGVAHAGPLGGVDGIVAAKGELLEALPASGVAVLNADDPMTPKLAARTAARVLTVGAQRADVVYRDLCLDAELRPRFRLVTPWGEREVALTMRGAHQAANAAMAATIAGVLDVPIDAVVHGLAGASGASGRMELHRAPGDVVVIDDSYNANPASSAAALAALAALAARRRIAVLGEMLELGDQGVERHLALGRLAGDLGIDVLVAVGPGAEPIASGAAGVGTVVRAADRDEAAAFARATLAPGDAVLVKASRAIGLETVVATLLEGPAPGEVT